MSEQDKRKALLELRLFLSTIVLLAILIVCAGSASYLIPAGEFVQKNVNGTLQQVYTTIPQAPVPVWKIAASPVMSLTGKYGINVIILLLFILIIGGSFSIMNKSGILPRVLSELVSRFSDKRRQFLIVNIVVFALIGSCLGVWEEITPMILIFVPLARRMRWDSLTGMAIPFAATGFGFAAATFNPFTIGTAQRLAGLPLFSGLSLRLPVFLLTLVILILYLEAYTRRIERDPSKSLSHDMDAQLDVVDTYGEASLSASELKPPLLFMAACFLGIIGIVLGGSMVPMIQELSFPLIALMFLIMGIGVGLLSGQGPAAVFRYFKEGLIDFAPAIILILMAAAVSYLIQEGKVMDTILYHVARQAEGVSKEGAVLLIFAFQTMMNFFVPSGSGLAMLTIPILAPLGDLIGITRQTVVLAFQFGDGFSNLLWPTNPLLLVALGLSGISYRDWFKWVLPLQILLAVVCIAFLIVAVHVGYS